MRKTRLKILLTAAVIVLIAAVVGLIVTLAHRNKSGKDKNALVTVWLRTAKNRLDNDGKNVSTVRYTYDEYGRCVKTEEIAGLGYAFDAYGYVVKKEELGWEAYVDTEMTEIEYDEETHRTTVTSPNKVSQMKDCEVYAPDGQLISSCSWKYDGDRYRKWREKIYEPDADGKYEFDSTVYYQNGYVSYVDLYEYNETLRKGFNKRAISFEDANLTDSTEWPMIKEAASRVGTVYCEDDYDEQGRCVRSCEITFKGTRRLSVETEYYDDGQSKQTTYGLYYNHIEYTDAQGRVLSESDVSNETGETSESAEYVYEELASGGYRETSYKTIGKHILIRIDEFDKNGVLIKSATIEDDGPEEIVYLATLDDQGRKIREEWPSYGDGSEREYDEYGNCIKETSKYGESVTVITMEYTSIVLEKEKAAYAESFYDPYRPVSE